MAIDTTVAGDCVTGGLDIGILAGCDPQAAGASTRRVAGDIEVDIHRADPQYRNRALLLLALTILLCGVLLVLLDGWLRTVNAHLLASDPDTVRDWLRWLLGGLGIGFAIPAWLLGRGLRHIGMQARDERRFPPRDWKTLRDVRILHDADALAWARRTMVAGNLALALAATLVLWAIVAWMRFG